MPLSLQGQHTLRILVADDDELTLDIYRNVFLYAGKKCDRREDQQKEAEIEPPFDFSEAITFDVSYCRNRLEAVEHVEQSIKDDHPFAMAFLDIRMPLSEDGILAGACIREMDPDIELVFATGFFDYDPREIAARVPPIHKMLYIQKPFDIHELLHFTYALGCKWLYEKNSRALRKNLEALVESKTADLKNANKNLERKIKERTEHLEEANTALKVLLSQRENDKKAMAEVFIGNTRHLVKPMIERLKSTKLNDKQKNIIRTIESNLNHITSPFVEKLGLQFHQLTPMELQVANFVKTGLSNKQTAEILAVSPGTIMAHRHNLREKLGITNKKINLRTHLLSLG